MPVKRFAVVLLALGCLLLVLGLLVRPFLALCGVITIVAAGTLFWQADRAEEKARKG